MVLSRHHGIVCAASLSQLSFLIMFVVKVTIIFCTVFVRFILASSAIPFHLPHYLPKENIYIYVYPIMGRLPHTFRFPRNDYTLRNTIWREYVIFNIFSNDLWNVDCCMGDSLNPNTRRRFPRAFIFSALNHRKHGMCSI